MLTGNKNCVNIFKLSYDSKLFLENCILNILNKLKSLDIRGAICTDKSHIKPRNKPKQTKVCD